MADWFTIKAVVYGEKDLLNKFYKEMRYGLDSNIEKDQESGWGKEWLKYVYQGVGINPDIFTDFRGFLRGAVEHIEMKDDYVEVMYYSNSDTNWEVIEYIINNKYPELTVEWLALDTIDNFTVKKDLKGKYFPEKYQLTYFLDEYYSFWFNDQESVLNHINNTFDTEYKTFEDLIYDLNEYAYDKHSEIDVRLFDKLNNLDVDLNLIRVLNFDEYEEYIKQFDKNHNFYSNRNDAIIYGDKELSDKLYNDVTRCLEKDNSLVSLYSSVGYTEYEIENNQLKLYHYGSVDSIKKVNDSLRLVYHTSHFSRIDIIENIINDKYAGLGVAWIRNNNDDYVSMFETNDVDRLYRKEKYALRYNIEKNYNYYVFEGYFKSWQELIKHINNTFGTNYKKFSDLYDDTHEIVNVCEGLHVVKFLKDNKLIGSIFLDKIGDVKSSLSWSYDYFKRQYPKRASLFEAMENIDFDDEDNGIMYNFVEELFDMEFGKSFNGSDTETRYYFAHYASDDDLEPFYEMFNIK